MSAATSLSSKKHPVINTDQLYEQCGEWTFALEMVNEMVADIKAKKPQMAQALSGDEFKVCK
jgi:hypothetical protein